MLIMLSSSWLCLFFILSPNYINLVTLLWLVQLQSSLRNLLLLTCLQECGPCFVCLLIWDYNKIKHLDFLLALRFALLAGILKKKSHLSISLRGTWLFLTDGLQKFYFYGNCHLNAYDALFDGETNPHM